ncbi:MAG: histidinol dehydrogenase [Candidatus Dormibacteria bacterium]
MPLDVPILDVDAWRSRVRRRRFSLPSLPGSVLAKLSEAVGRPVRDALDGVDEIIAQVRDGGDTAVQRLSLAFDGAAPDPIEVPRTEWQAAAAAVPAEQRRAIDAAGRRIEAFHALQRPTSILAGELELRPQPLRRVGLYVPGGRARYPSTVLMNAIPARLAGVDEILVTTPPSAAGLIPPAVLYAAEVAGVHRVFRVGGAQAIAALAYGTESIPPVDKITGPGNVFVTLAKRQVYGVVGIDSLAGPSEILVIADHGADAEQVVVDLASQLEHDPNAWAVLFTDDRALGEEVAARLSADPLANRFGSEAAELHAAVVVLPDIATAIELAEEFSPEHLELLVEDVDEHLPQVRGAGMVFASSWSPVPIGDYVAGSNHTLPTGGAARFTSPLGVYDFYRWTSVVRLGRETASQIAPVGIEMAKMEGLEAHERSLRLLVARAGNDASDSLD